MFIASSIPGKLGHPLKVLLAASALLIFLSWPCFAKEYNIPEIGGSLSLSGQWAPMDPSLVKTQNDDMLRVRPKSVVRFVAGFIRGSSLSTEYIWVQRSPNSNPPMTPENLTAMLPKTAAKLKPEMERLMKDKVAASDPGVTHYEPRLGAVVWDMNTTLPNGDIARMRAYLIVTKSSVVSIEGVSAPENADVVFEEVQGIVSTLNLKEDEKMPQSWFDHLRQVVGSSK